MPDLEKVIKGLECCMSEKICNSKCPYKGQCDDGGYYYSKAIEDALALLKERESIRPGLGIIHHDDGSKSYFLHCPLDGTTLVDGDNYCRRCGRAVKWE